MRKCVFFFIIFFGGTLVFSQTRMVVFGSVSYSIVTTPEEFVAAYQNNKMAAISLKAKDFTVVAGKIMDLCAKQKINVMNVFDPNLVMNARTKQQYSRQEVTNLLNRNPSSPNDDIYLLTYENRENTKNLSKETEAKNIKAYFKFIASIWWSNQSGGRLKQCDDCNKSMNYGEGYCFGFYQAPTDSYRILRLWCDDCMDVFIQGHITGKNPVDHDIVLQANDYANGR